MRPILMAFSKFSNSEQSIFHGSMAFLFRLTKPRTQSTLSNGIDISRTMATSLRTKGISRIRKRNSLLPGVIRSNSPRVQLCKTINSRLDGATEARQTSGRIHQRRYSNHHFHHHSCQSGSLSLSHLWSRPKIHFQNYSTTSSPENSVGRGNALPYFKLSMEDKSMINVLVQYRGNHGDCHIPTGNAKNAQEEREKLGVSNAIADWVVKQRKLYRQSSNKKKQISDTLLAKFMILESIGFIWSCREAKWQRYFNKLEKIYGSQEEGNLFILKEQDDPQLYAWTEQQRKAFRKGTMPMERENLLRTINFVFDPNEAKWWQKYRDLCKYHDEHQSTMVPLVDEDENPNYLGQWVTRQRRLYHDDSLGEDRIQALNDINFSWDPEAESWEKYYNQLCDFHRKHNHTRVPKSMGPLWNWVDRQRKSYRKRLRLRDANNSGETNEEVSRSTLITKENVQKLSTLGFEWEDTPPKGDAEYRMEKLMNVTFELSIHDENWANRFENLCAFYKKFNHFSIPTAAGEYKELNTWVRHTRYLYNSNRLPQNRVELLDSIGFAWTAEDAKWDRLCEELFLFHKENGHCDVPRKNTELYRWAKHQKENHQSGESNNFGTKAKIERKRRLETLDEILF